MSSARTAHSEDIVRLRHARLDVEFREGHLVVRHVPYVNVDGEVGYGILVSTLEPSPYGVTQPISDHKVWFGGELPCGRDRVPVDFVCETRTHEIVPGFLVDFCFSLKPETGYRDYHHKMVSYVDRLMMSAIAIDPDATAYVKNVIETIEDDNGSPFVYEDTASTRAGIRAISAKLKISKIAIVGLGGTGSYILDLLAKCPIAEIHLFDGDLFEQHNAFRAPGAASLEQLDGRPFKVNYLAPIYSNMHRGIVPHAYAMDETSVEQLRDMEFVFLALSDGRTRKTIVDKLEEFGIEFIDVGLSMSDVESGLTGMIRVTLSTRGNREEARALLVFSDGEGEDIYSRNIQVADLNCLNAALAVTRWKRHCGFLIDLENEIESLYMTVGNGIVNEVA